MFTIICVTFIYVTFTCVTILSLKYLCLICVTFICVTFIFVLLFVSPSTSYPHPLFYGTLIFIPSFVFQLFVLPSFVLPCSKLPAFVSQTFKIKVHDFSIFFSKINGSFSSLFTRNNFDYNRVKMLLKNEPFFICINL